MLNQNTIVGNCRKLLSNPFYRQINVRTQAIIAYWNKFDNVRIHRDRHGDGYLKMKEIYRATPAWHIDRAIRKAIQSGKFEIDIKEESKRKEKAILYGKEYKN